MVDEPITFSILFETVVVKSNRGEKYLESKYYNDFVNMIVRDSRWPNTVSFVSTNPTAARLVSTNWAEVDFPNLIEILVTNGYTVTVVDTNTYTITKTMLNTVEAAHQSTVTTLNKRRSTGHKEREGTVRG